MIGDLRSQLLEQKQTSKDPSSLLSLLLLLLKSDREDQRSFGLPNVVQRPKGCPGSVEKRIREPIPRSRRVEPSCAVLERG